MSKRINVLVGLLAPMSMAFCATAAQAQKFEVQSTSYSDGGVIHSKQAGTTVECGAGEGQSPQISWHNLPSGAKSIAVMMFDPDGQKGLGVSHWVAYNIDAHRNLLQEGEGGSTRPGITVGKNVAGQEAYRGPCPPVGDAPHHYTVTVIVSSLVPGSLPPGLTREELLAKLKGHTVIGQSIVGRYGQ